MTRTDPFAAILAAPPEFSSAQAERIALEHYGLKASARGLVSERDQNFLLTGADSSRAILKVANAAEPHEVTEFQIDALLHIERKAIGDLGVPRILPTSGGSSYIEVASSQGMHIVRLVSFLPGSLLEDQVLDAAMAQDLGRLLGKLDTALLDFTHPGQNQALLWDMKQAPALKSLLPHVQEDAVRSLLAATLTEFEVLAASRFEQLPWQVIHNDANPANVLLSGDPSPTVSGLIDFGDMLRSPRIIELAVAAAYLRVTDGNPLALIAQLLSGYHAVAPLERAEVDILHSLVKTRLASTLLILSWRESIRSPEDPYLATASQAEASALPFLERLAEVPLDNAATIYSQVCASIAVAGRPPEALR